MRFASVAIALAFGSGLALAQGTAGSLTVTSPAVLTECQPASITIAGGTAPYLVAIIPGGQVSAAPLVNLPAVSAAGAFTYNVNVARGTNVTIRVTDSQGLVQYSSPIVVQPGTSTACLTQSASLSQATGAASASATSTLGQSTTTAQTAATQTQQTSAATSPVSSNLAPSSAAQTTSRSGAGKLVAGSAAGLLGVAAVALMA